jgi:hypothetical protein
LTAIGSGVMIRTGKQPTLYGALYSLNNQCNKHFHIGALTALELLGYSHYIPMGRPQVVVYYPRGEWVPVWMEQYDWGVDVLKVSSGYFDSQTGITTTIQGEFEILLSSPERAFMESLNLAPKYYNLTDLYYVMEQLNTLRPDVVQILLEQNNSIKVNRLFLYMADKAGHTWFDAIDVSKVSMGNGKREIVKNGVYNSKYQIVIPEDLANYE